MRGELVGEFAWFPRIHQHVAACDIDLVLQGQGHRLTVGGAGQLAAEGNNLLHPRSMRRSHDLDRVAQRYRAGRDRAGKPAEFLVRAVDPLNWETERL